MTKIQTTSFPLIAEFLNMGAIEILILLITLAFVILIVVIVILFINNGESFKYKK